LRFLITRIDLRAAFADMDHDVQLDIGFNDPLVPPPVPVDYPLLIGGVAANWCCRPETMIG
jgi:hypothetical protein